jgi:hypothetical protein
MNEFEQDAAAEASQEAYPDQPERAIRSATTLSDALSANTAALKQVTERYRNVWIAIVVLVITIFISLYAAVRAQQGVDEIEKARSEARIASCQQDNIRIDQHNKLTEAVRGILNLTNTTSTVATRTPEQQARAEAFFANANMLLNETIVPVRDCSPAGITAYFTVTTSKPDG